jgi:hypothetical protein
VGDTVIACESKMLDSLRAHYELNILENEARCTLAVATGKKEVSIENGALKMENGQ